MDVNKQDEIVVSLKNEPGTLAEITETLGNEGINILGYTVQPAGEQGSLRLVTDDPSGTAKVLKGAGFSPQTRQVLVAPLPNKPGELARAAKQLAKSGINIESSYVSMGPQGSTPQCAFEVKSIDSAMKVFKG